MAFELLGREGLRADEDYRVEAFGATPRRVTALLSGACAATVLNAGNDIVAEDAGANRRFGVAQVGPYIGSVLTATGKALTHRGPALRDLAAILQETARYILTAPDDAILPAISRRLGLAGDAATRHLTIMRDPVTGLIPSGRVDPASLETVIALRRAHGILPPAVDDSLIDQH